MTVNTECCKTAYSCARSNVLLIVALQSTIYNRIAKACMENGYCGVWSVLSDFIADSVNMRLLSTAIHEWMQSMQR